MAEENTTPVLDLDALAPERPKVKFPGGKFYDLTVPTDLGLVQIKQIQIRAKQVERLHGIPDEDLTEEQVDTLSKALNWLARALVRKASAEETDGLSDVQKLNILFNFNAMFGPDKSAPNGERGDEVAPLSTTES